MNYIKQMMEDMGIEVNEEFYVIKKGVKFKAQVVVNHGIIIYDDKVKSFKFAESSIYHEILSGYCEIEKIKHKPKTLVEQLREQDKGYLVNQEGFIYKYTGLQRCILELEKQIKQGNMKLTRADAEKEVYRRLLEFEMQEWAREHNEGEIDWRNNKSNKYYIYYHFEIKKMFINWDYMTKESANFDAYYLNKQIAEMAVEKFGDRMKKYYEWESE